MSNRLIQEATELYWWPHTRWFLEQSGYRIPVAATDSDAEFLYRMASDASLPDGDILEIGTFYGGSAIIFALGNRQRGKGEMVLTVDSLPKGAFYEAAYLVSAVERFTRLRDLKISMMIGDSKTASRLLSKRFRLAYVDAGHTKEAVQSDIINVVGLVKAGGIILVHDLHLPSVAEVFERAAELSPQITVEDTYGDIGILRVT